MARAVPLPDRLLGCASPAAACRAACDHLGARDGLLPSVYLERGGLLRLQHCHGYWQALDGMRPSAGVIGTAYAEGAPQLIADVGGDERYLAAAQGVVAEASFPVRVGGRVAGVLNVEAHRPLAADELADIEATADALGHRLAAIGSGAAGESPAQRLVRHALRVAALREPAAIEAEIVDAARDVGPLGSAAWVEVDALGRERVRHGRGPLAGRLGALPTGVVGDLLRYARGGSSVTTTGGPGAAGPGYAELLAVGVRSCVVLPVGTEAADGAASALLIADAGELAIVPEDVELLELLAAHATVALRTAAHVEDLREQAASDPLTGLGHHATFQQAMRDAVASRDGRVALLVADVDGFKRFNDRHGHPAGDRVLKEVASCLQGGLRRGDGLFRIGGDEFAAVLAAQSETEAEEVARRLHSAVAFGGSGVSVSVGVAFASPGEDAAALLERADRALYAAKERGRNGVALAPAASAA